MLEDKVSMTVCCEEGFYINFSHMFLYFGKQHKPYNCPYFWSDLDVYIYFLQQSNSGRRDVAQDSNREDIHDLSGMYCHFTRTAHLCLEIHPSDLSAKIPKAVGGAQQEHMRQ